MSDQRPFGRTRRPRGVNEQGRIIGACPDGLERVRGLADKLGERKSAIAGVDTDEDLQVRQGRFQILDHRYVRRVGDHRLGGAVAQAVLHRFRAEQDRQRQGNGSDLVGGEMGHGGLHPLRQDDGDAIFATDAKAEQGIGKAIG